MFNKLFTGDSPSYFTVLFSLLLLVASGQALAASSGGFDFTPDSPVPGEATITGLTAGNTATDVAIPPAVGGGLYRDQYWGFCFFH